VPALLSLAGMKPSVVAVGRRYRYRLALDRGCFACALGGPGRETLFMMAQEWRGPENMFEGPRTGQVLTAQAPAPGVGWP
jgi:sugar lactone lactonase YvrE